MLKFNCPRQHGLDCVRNGCTKKTDHHNNNDNGNNQIVKKKDSIERLARQNKKGDVFFASVFVLYASLRARPANLRDKRTGERVKIYFHRLL